MSTEERQREILKTALEIIHDKGYKNLTVRSIADRVDISEPAIYRHFDNKEEIVKNLAEMVFKEDKILVEQGEHENPFDLLRDLLHSHFKRLEQTPHFTAVLFQSEIFREYPEVRKLFVDHREEKKKALERIVKDGQESGYFSKEADAEIFASLFMGVVRFSALKWRDDGFSYRLTEKASPIADQLFKILRGSD